MTGNHLSYTANVHPEPTVGPVLTRQSLPAEYRPLPNVGFLLLQIVGFSAPTTLIAMTEPDQHPWKALVYGVPLGVVCSLPFVHVWMKNAPHFLRLPPRLPALVRFLGEGWMPEARQTILVFFFTWSLMCLVGGAWFFFLPQWRGGAPEIAPVVAPVVTWNVIWMAGYLIWWWRLPAGEDQPPPTSARRRGWRSLWPFAGERHVLLTRFTPEQCRELLRARVTPDSEDVTLSLSFLPATSGESIRTMLHSKRDSSSRPSVCGFFYATGLTLRKTIQYGNPFQTAASVKLIRTPAGTRVMVCLGMEEISAVGLAICLGSCVVFTLFMIAGGRSSPEAVSVPPIVLMCLGFLTFGYAMLVISRSLARDEGPFLLQFVRETLEADKLPDNQS